MMEARAHRVSISARGAILIIVIGGLLLTSVYPVRRFISMRGETRALEAEGRALDERIAELTQEAALLESDAEVERLARERLGMVRPGEVPFVVAGPDSVSDDPVVESPQRRRVSDRPFVSRWWETVRRSLFASP